MHREDMYDLRTGLICPASCMPYSNFLILPQSQKCRGILEPDSLIPTLSAPIQNTSSPFVCFIILLDGSCGVLCRVTVPWS